MVIINRICCPDDSQPHLCELVAKLCSENMGQGHELFRLIGGVAEHVALVSCSHVFKGFGAETMHTLANVWRLLFDVYKNLVKERSVSGSMQGIIQWSAHLLHCIVDTNRYSSTSPSQRLRSPRSVQPCHNHSSCSPKSGRTCCRFWNVKDTLLQQEYASFESGG